ncbi:hypothetical protein Pint_32988 [Pistacia integerrima]|uniref:Uncharacterized protein n=1 Tax=Pistacia integerrima TaxID=434235 RepID=A0ACC0X3P4_9ROSI|nr:hypothetical protein Pint_32988 [Pistacia integerrima]
MKTRELPTGFFAGQSEECRARFRKMGLLKHSAMMMNLWMQLKMGLQCFWFWLCKLDDKPGGGGAFTFWKDKRYILPCHMGLIDGIYLIEIRRDVTLFLLHQQLGQKILLTLGS